MSNESEWSIELYATPAGRVPVAEFLLALDTKTRARFRWSMEQLRVRNVHAREPLVKKIDSDLWELREESGANTYRIIYFFFTGRRIIFLHGFQKRARRRPGANWKTHAAITETFSPSKRGVTHDERPH